MISPNASPIASSVGGSDLSRFLGEGDFDGDLVLVLAKWSLATTFLPLDVSFISNTLSITFRWPLLTALDIVESV